MCWGKRPREMRCMRLPWNGILRSLGKGQSTCSREWGFAVEFSLFYQKIPPDSAGEQLERERKGFAMKSQNLQKNVSTVPPLLRLKLKVTIYVSQ